MLTFWGHPGPSQLYAWVDLVIGLLWARVHSFGMGTQGLESNAVRQFGPLLNGQSTFSEQTYGVSWQHVMRISINPESACPDQSHDRKCIGSHLEFQVGRMSTACDHCSQSHLTNYVLAQFSNDLGPLLSASKLKPPDFIYIRALADLSRMCMNWTTSLP